jgi:hypothetical protein
LCSRTSVRLFISSGSQRQKRRTLRGKDGRRRKDRQKIESSVGGQRALDEKRVGGKCGDRNAADTHVSKSETWATAS